jgi:glutathione S-transferase
MTRTAWMKDISRHTGADRCAGSLIAALAVRHVLGKQRKTVMTKLTLISSPACPYVQRAVTALKEKGAGFDVAYVDLTDKPDWFLIISPLGKVPVLKVEREGHEPAALFESAVILEYLEETAPGPRLHPEDPLERARHRSWIEFGSQLHADVWRLATAKTQLDYDAARQAVAGKLQRLETEVCGPFFAGERFSYVDAVFAPAFRQFDALETIADIGLTRDLPKVGRWRKILLGRPSVRDAAPTDYLDIYLRHLRKMDGFLLHPVQ